MASVDLQKQNELADSLIAKLERIKALWDELPSDDYLTNLNRQVEGVAESLKNAAETFQSDEFPSAEYLGELCEKADGLAKAMKEAAESEAAE